MTTGKKSKKTVDKTWGELKNDTKEKVSYKQVFGVMKNLSLDDSLTSVERKTIYKKTIYPNKKEIDSAARKVQAGTHEFANAATTTTFGMQTALGLNHMERTAEGINNQQVTIDYIIQNQRIPTTEYLCKPIAVKELPQHKQRFFKGNKDQHVFHGHVGSANYETTQGKKPLVLREGAGRSGFHIEQKEAQEKSHHHVTYSRRLSKSADEHQTRGKDILDAYESSGFNENSFWENSNIKSPEDALNQALVAEHNYKKRQTKEKKLRSIFVEPTNASETYDEISTVSETNTEEFDDFIERKMEEKEFKSFMKKFSL